MIPIYSVKVSNAGYYNVPGVPSTWGLQDLLALIGREDGVDFQFLHEDGSYFIVNVRRAAK